MRKPTQLMLRKGAKAFIQETRDSLSFRKNRTSRYTDDWDLLERLEAELQDIQHLWFPTKSAWTKAGAQ
jgi:hypothetical protein